jgi:hypothetical protein
VFEFWKYPNKEDRINAELKIYSTTLPQKTVNLLVCKYKGRLEFISQAKNSSNCNSIEENQHQSDYKNFNKSKKATTQT